MVAGDVAGMSEQKSFFTTLPGILSGLAALLTAIGGLVYALSQAGAKQEAGQILRELESLSGEKGGLFCFLPGAFPDAVSRCLRLVCGLHHQRQDLASGLEHFDRLARLTEDFSQDHRIRGVEVLTAGEGLPEM